MDPFFKDTPAKKFHSIKNRQIRAGFDEADFQRGGQIRKSGIRVGKVEIARQPFLPQALPRHDDAAGKITLEGFATSASGLSSKMKRPLRQAATEEGSTVSMLPSWPLGE